MANFKRSVNALLAKYEPTSLRERWDEAVGFGEGVEAKAFWIRDSQDVVNIVWLNRDGIRDISYFPGSDSTMLNFILLRNIITFEIRESADEARSLDLGVDGDYVVQVISAGPRGQTFWVAATKTQAKNLKSFMRAVMSEYVVSR